jgi:hypothetical protein
MQVLFYNVGVAKCTVTWQAHAGCTHASSFKARAKQTKNKFLQTDPFYIQSIIIYYNNRPNNML